MNPGYRQSRTNRRRWILARRRKRDREHRFALRLFGLTSRGRPRKLKIWPKHLFRGCKTTRQKNTIYNRIRGLEHQSQGRTWNGQPRKYKQWTEISHLHGRERERARKRIYNLQYRAKNRMTALDRAWQTFRETTFISVNTETK